MTGGSPAATAGWHVVAEQECRDLWVSGRGPILLFAYSVLLSVLSVLTATNQLLNFLEHREAVNLVLVVAVTVGVLGTLLVSADAISGERERETLEALLLAPVSRRAILFGKFTAALSLWLASYLVAVPYLVVLGRGVSLTGTALVLGFVVGGMLAVAVASFGLLVSAVSSTNRVSIGVSMLVLLALFVPTQLPAMPASWIGDLVVRVDPLGSAMHYLTGVLVRGQRWDAEWTYLASPLASLLLAGGSLLAIGPRAVRLGKEG